MNKLRAGDVWCGEGGAGGGRSAPPGDRSGGDRSPDRRGWVPWRTVHDLRPAQGRMKGRTDSWCGV